MGRRKMKKSYRLSEVCRLLELQPYVLRYWVTEFAALQGEQTGDGPQAGFSERGLALLRRIKTLLYEEGYTIAGARKKLENDGTPPSGSGEAAAAGAGLLFDEAGNEAPATTPPAAGKRLDTSEDERIETLRRGISAALEEARALLALLAPRD
jgi:DNA-binding transcriptional MerR regulator